MDRTGEIKVRRSCRYVGARRCNCDVDCEILVLVLVVLVLVLLLLLLLRLLFILRLLLLLLPRLLLLLLFLLLLLLLLLLFSFFFFFFLLDSIIFSRTHKTYYIITNHKFNNFLSDPQNLLHHNQSQIPATVQQITCRKALCAKRESRGLTRREVRPPRAPEPKMGQNRQQN